MCLGYFVVVHVYNLVCTQGSWGRCDLSLWRRILVGTLSCKENMSANADNIPCLLLWQNYVFLGNLITLRYYYYYHHHYTIWMSLVTGLFFLVHLLNQRWSPPLTLQASHCSTFRIMCDVPSIAVFCSEYIECFPGTASKCFLKLLVTIPVAPIITGIIVQSCHDIQCPGSPELTTVRHRALCPYIWRVNWKCSYATACACCVKKNDLSVDMLLSTCKGSLVHVAAVWTKQVNKLNPFVSTMLINTVRFTVVDCNPVGSLCWADV
jgi:hypothetical protein